MDLSPQRDCFFVWPLCYCRCRFLQRWLYERFDISLLHRCCRLDGFPTQNDRTSIHMIVVPPCTRTIALFSRLTSVPSFGFTVGEPGRFSFHVAPLARQSLTRFEGIRKPLFVPHAGCRNCLDRNTKRGERLRVSSAKYRLPRNFERF